eukprot:448528-Hanusia_phi.AAC.2
MNVGEAPGRGHAEKFRKCLVELAARRTEVEGGIRSVLVRNLKLASKVEPGEGEAGVTQASSGLGGGVMIMAVCIFESGGLSLTPSGWNLLAHQGCVVDLVKKDHIVLGVVQSHGSRLLSTRCTEDLYE